MTRVVLIQPPVFRDALSYERSPLIDQYWISSNKIQTQYGDIDSEPNIGLLYVAASLIANGFDVLLLDFHALDLQKRKAYGQGINRLDIRDKLVCQDLSIVGISCLTSNSHWARLISDTVKEINSRATVILGGIFATFFYTEIMKKWASIDVAVRGEGEETIVEALTCLLNRKPLTSVRGVSFRDASGRLVHNPKRNLISDIDSIPYPAYELVKQNYETLVFRVLLARGCGYECSFCAPSAFFEHTVRYRNPSRVVDQLSYLNAQYRNKVFLLGDTTFFQSGPNATGNYYETLCTEIANNGLNISWWCQSRLELITPYRAELLRAAGCVQLALGVESGSQRVRNRLSKENDIDSIYGTCALLKAQGIKVQAYVMIGLPGETVDDVICTIKLIEELILKSYIDVTNISVLVPFPGTDVYNNASRHGIRILDYNFDNYYMCVSDKLNPYPVYETNYLSINQIRALWEYALASITKAQDSLRAIQPKE